MRSYLDAICQNQKLVQNLVDQIEEKKQPIFTVRYLVLPHKNLKHDTSKSAAS